MTIKISQNFDSGAIDVVRADSAGAIDLKLRKDSHADIHQWFHFRLQGAAGQAVASVEVTLPLIQSSSAEAVVGRTAAAATRRR